MREPDWQSECGTARLWCGDNLELLRAMPDESVNCCVTSPPYFGLRDYGTATWEGGDATCDHVNERQLSRNLNHSASDQRQGRTADPGKLRDGVAGVARVCQKCGATRIDKQIGLEATPEAYVAKLVAVFSEVRRVLTDDGTCWINLGDTYNAYNANRGSANGANKNHHEIMPSAVRGLTCPALKNKDLIGIPWMVAFALRADGWYLRSEIIWHKPNPMPESVTDRPTKAHEQLFLLTKSARYWYDADAIAEPHNPEHLGRYARPFNVGPKELSGNGRPDGASNTPGMKEPNPAGRNRRSVWTIATQPYPEAHFATFPPKLIEPCILAGCPEGGIVLDLFSGSGTTGEVAVKLGRCFIGLELNPEYVELSQKRIGAVTQYKSLFPVRERETQKTLLE